MSSDIEGFPNLLTVEPWCKVFHHSTEYLIMGKLMTPTKVKIPAALPAKFLSSKALCKAMTPK